MTHAYFSCDCESVMNDLFSTFSRYNGGSLSLKSCCETVCICYSDSSLSALSASFEVSHSGTNMLSLFLRRSLALLCFHCVLSLFLHPVLCNALTISICPLQVQATENLSVMVFSFFLFSSLPHFWGHSFMAPTSTVVKPSRPQKLYNFSSAFKVIGASNM